MKIGFFDSGLGGLTVLKEAIDKEGLDDEIYYLGDNKNTPYGTKDEKEVLKYVEDNIDYLVTIGCNPIVIACNTATCLAIKYLREKYKEIVFIGTEPAVKVAADAHMNKKIIVLATSITVKQEKLLNLIDNLNIKENVDLIPADKLVEFAESLDFSQRNAEILEYLKNIFKDIDLENYSHIVLGCTHFPLFYEHIYTVLKELAPNSSIKVVDGNSGIAKNLVKHIKELKNESQQCKKEINIILTKDSDTFKSRVKQVLNGEKINFKYKLQ